MKTTFALALAAAAIALGSTAAHAAVVSGTFAKNASSLALGGVSGKVAFTTPASVGFFSLTTAFDANATGSFRIGADDVSFGSLIGPGTPMQSGLETLDSTFVSLFSGSSVNDLAVGNDLLLPFEFTKAGHTDYGWIEFDVTKSKLNTYAFKLESYAYADNGEAIRAGTLQAVPEPTSLALMLAGAAGLVGWRRRSQVRG